MCIDTQSCKAALFTFQVENHKPTSSNALASKIQFSSSNLQKPHLGSVYAHKTSKVHVETEHDVEELGGSVIPIESGERIVAAFQRVQAQVEGWRGADIETEASNSISDEEPYEDKTFITG